MTKYKIRAYSKVTQEHRDMVALAQKLTELEIKPPKEVVRYFKALGIEWDYRGDWDQLQFDTGKEVDIKDVVKFWGSGEDGKAKYTVDLRALPRDVVRLSFDIDENEKQEQEEEEQPGEYLYCGYDGFYNFWEVLDESSWDSAAEHIESLENDQSDELEESRWLFEVKRSKYIGKFRRGKLISKKEPK